MIPESSEDDNLNLIPKGLCTPPRVGVAVGVSIDGVIVVTGVIVPTGTGVFTTTGETLEPPPQSNAVTTNTSNNNVTIYLIILKTGTVGIEPTMTYLTGKRVHPVRLIPTKRKRNIIEPIAIL